jgi:hypothetical protein
MIADGRRGGRGGRGSADAAVRASDPRLQVAKRRARRLRLAYVTGPGCNLGNHPGSRPRPGPVFDLDLHPHGPTELAGRRDELRQRDPGIALRRRDGHARLSVRGRAGGTAGRSMVGTAAPGECRGRGTPGLKTPSARARSRRRPDPPAPGETGVVSTRGGWWKPGGHRRVNGTLTTRRAGRAALTLLHPGSRSIPYGADRSTRSRVRRVSPARGFGRSACRGEGRHWGDAAAAAPRPRARDRDQPIRSAHRPSSWRSASRLVAGWGSICAGRPGRRLVPRRYREDVRELRRAAARGASTARRSGPGAAGSPPPASGALAEGSMGCSPTTPAGTDRQPGEEPRAPAAERWAKLRIPTDRHRGRDPPSKAIGETAPEHGATARCRAPVTWPTGRPRRRQRGHRRPRGGVTGGA